MRVGGPGGGPGGLLGADRSTIAGARFDGTVVRRVWRFARPYRWMLLAYVGTIIAQALVQLTPPLLFRSIIDSAIPQGVDGGDRGLLHLLAGLAVLAAFANGRPPPAHPDRSPPLRRGGVYHPPP